MKTYKHNGEHWYVDSRSLFKRLRNWVVWFGGWEKANGAGWKLRRDWPLRGFYGPTPVAILGHRVTFFGQWMDIRLRRTYLVIRFRKSYSGGPYAYLSDDGTSSRAHHWLFGAPHAVRRAAEKRAASTEY